MTDVNQVIRLVQNHLSQADIDSPQAEAATIVAHVLGISRGRLGVLRALAERLDAKAVEQITQLAKARATRTPLQYLIGTAAFYGLEVKVAPGVFIPRVETEILVETTLRHFASHPGPLKILDLCTGTGAIAAALAEQLQQRNIPTQLWAIDICPQAAQLADENTTQYNVSVLCADATDHHNVITAAPELAPLRAQIDAVVANPPYIPTTTPVTQYEAEQDPDLALYGGSADGTAIPLRIAKQAAGWLAPGGFFMMEHDHTHAQQLVDALTADPAWEQPQTVKDLTGAQRFVMAIRTPSVKPTPNSSPTLAQ